MESASKAVNNGSSATWTTAIVVFVVIVIVCIIAAFIYFSACSKTPSVTAEVKDRNGEVEEVKCKTALAQEQDGVKSIYSKPIKLSQAEQKHALNRLTKDELIQKYKHALTTRDFSTIVPKVARGNEVVEAVKRIHLGHKIHYSMNPRHVDETEKTRLKRKAQQLAQEFNSKDSFMPPMNPQVIDAAN